MFKNLFKNNKKQKLEHLENEVSILRSKDRSIWDVLESLENCYDTLKEINDELKKKINVADAKIEAMGRAIDTQNKRIKELESLTKDIRLNKEVEELLDKK